MPKTPGTRFRWQSPSLGAFVLVPLVIAVVWANPPTSPPAASHDSLSGSGIRMLVGRHIVLYTDLPAAPPVDDLPKVFDAAVPLWSQYFRVAPGETATWRITGYLMRNKERFSQSNLLPADLPPFAHGYQRGDEMWVYEQPSDYYRRHLLLHEGTHAFMNRFLGGDGPAWYREGIAELLATHRWQDEKLEFAYLPRHKREVPEWGRIKVVRDDVAASRDRSLREVTQTAARDFGEVKAYAWCWAACAFLDQHPLSQEHFRRLRDQVALPPEEFSGQLLASFEADRPRLVEAWQLFLHNLDYGYDVAQDAIEYRPKQPLRPGGASLQVAADRSWQSTGVVLERGRAYRLTAEGRYRLGEHPKTWWCEPQGVTIRYHRGRPLGMLMAAVGDDERRQLVTPFVNPVAVGRESVLVPEWTGTLFLRINEPAGELRDNQGTVVASITAVDHPSP